MDVHPLSWKKSSRWSDALGAENQALPDSFINHMSETGLANICKTGYFEKANFVYDNPMAILKRNRNETGKVISDE